jgi:hypothetical protein
MRRWSALEGSGELAFAAAGVLGSLCVAPEVGLHLVVEANPCLPRAIRVLPAILPEHCAETESQTPLGEQQWLDSAGCGVKLARSQRRSRGRPGARADRRSRVALTRAARARDDRVHRLVQHRPPALRATSPRPNTKRDGPRPGPERCRLRPPQPPVSYGRWRVASDG